jgi:uncharacterized protein YbcV (DUF1398 family)
MNTNDKIQNTYKSATNYPDLAKRLLEAGVKSYTVETSSGTILYRLDDGETILHHGNIAPRIIVEKFDEEKTIAAIRNNQNGKTDYLGFMNEIANAGVRFYEAILSGKNRRVTYIGIGGFYEEMIP